MTTAPNAARGVDVLATVFAFEHEVAVTMC